MDLLLIFLWAVPFIAWVAVFHLWRSGRFSFAQNRNVRWTMLVIEISCDIIFAILYFNGIFPVISNFLTSVFK